MSDGQKMSAQAIIQSANAMQKYLLAERWFEQCGAGSIAKDSAPLFSVTFLVGGNVPGAEEAADILVAMARLEIKTLFARARENNRNTIGIYLDQIGTEIGRPVL